MAVITLVVYTMIQELTQGRLINYVGGELCVIAFSFPLGKWENPKENRF